MDQVETNEEQLPEIELEEDRLQNEEQTIRFVSMVKFYVRLSALRGVRKSAYVREFIRTLFKSNRNPKYTYSILRLLLPAEDRERGNYGLKEKALARVITESLRLEKEEYDRLYHYKNPNYHKDGVGLGDFSICTYEVVKEYMKESSQLTVKQLNDLLDRLTQDTDQTGTFRELIVNSNAEQLKWVIRIILKDLKLGIKIEAVLNTFHPDGNQCFNLVNSLKETCRKLESLSVSLNDEIEMFHSIRPMLAGKKRLEYFKTQTRLFYVETKYDGERIQAHVSPEMIKLFSRNGVDYAQTYEELLPVLNACVKCDACILDGEMIVIDRETHAMKPFGLNKVPAFSKADANLQILYKIFDVLWIKKDIYEMNMMGYPLRERKKIITEVIAECPGRVQLVRFQQMLDYDDIIKEFSLSIDRHEEGIILKDPNSIYVPKERGLNWLKLKGDYIQGLTESLDLIILGGYYGGVSYRLGKDSHWTSRITCFLLGVIDRIDELNPKIAYATPFARVGEGYGEDEIAKLRSKLKPHLIQYDGKSKPSFISGSWKPSIANRPDCFVDHLCNSVVLEVKAAQLMESDQWPTECTMRFARVTTVRFDKHWSEALTKDQLSQLLDETLYTKNMHKKKQQDQSNSDCDNENSEIKQRKRREVEQKNKKMKNIVLDEFTGVDVSHEKLVSHLFNQDEFVVMPLNSYLKHEVEKAIWMNNGIISQNPLKTTKYIVSQDIDFRLRTYNECRTGRFTFIKPKYVFNCIKAGRLLPLSPLYLTLLPRGSSEHFIDNFDKFGDSYAACLDEQELQQVLAGMATDYPLNARLAKAIALQYPRGSKCSLCFGVNRLTTIKLRYLGNKFTHSFEGNPNSIIIAGELCAATQAAILSYLQRGGCELQKVEDIRL